MKKIILPVALVISIMLAVSCKTAPKDIEVEVQEKDLPDATNVTIGLDLTGARTYKVKWGDTLSKISRRFYKDGFYYPIIMLASPGVVKNPDKIIPGMVLTIPDLERNKANANGRKCIKDRLNEFADIEKAKPRPRRGLIDGFRKRAGQL